MHAVTLVGAEQGQQVVEVTVIGASAAAELHAAVGLQLTLAFQLQHATLGGERQLAALEGDLVAADRVIGAEARAGVLPGDVTIGREVVWAEADILDFTLPITAQTEGLDTRAVFSPERGGRL